MGGRLLPPFIFPLVLGCFTAVSYAFFVVVYTVQPTPFIDEVFHVPQAQKYCRGLFHEWDPKITTLPGLYLFSIGLNGPVSWVLGRELCDVFSLRITNLVAAVFTLATLHKILLRLHGTKVDNWKVVLGAVNLSLVPVLYWFTFLYYTDVLSTLVVLLMLLLYLHRAPNASAAMGLVAVMMRQTNVIWVGFLAVLMALESLGLRLLKYPIASFLDLKALVKKMRKTAAKPYRLAEVLADVVVDCFCYSLVLAGFLLFVFYNGSVVVGDRSAHEATVHLPQLGYFCLFFLIFSLPYAPAHVRPFVRLCRRRPGPAVALLVVGVMVVHSNTLVHPYLLADNRHLTFYLWGRVYARFPPVRYLMVPVYMFGGYLAHTFIQHRPFVYRALFLLCLAAATVPNRLLEFRYFIVPFLLLRLEHMSRSWWQLWIETLYFMLINALTLYLFVSKTFLWDDSTELQRIIW